MNAASLEAHLTGSMIVVVLEDSQLRHHSRHASSGDHHVEKLINHRHHLSGLAEAMPRQRPPTLTTAQFALCRKHAESKKAHMSQVNIMPATYVCVHTVIANATAPAASVERRQGESSMDKAA